MPSMEAPRGPASEAWPPWLPKVLGEELGDKRMISEVLRGRQLLSESLPAGQHVGGIAIW